MKKKKPSRSKATTLFDPDSIATTLHRTIVRDLDPSKQTYGGDWRTLELLRSNLCSDFLKKYVSVEVGKSNSLESATFRKFLEVNDHMAAYRRLETPTVEHPRQTKCRRDKILLRARALMHFVLGETFDIEELFLACKHGPGTTVGVPFADTSMEQKFRYPMSVTECAKPLMAQFFLWDDRLREAVQRLNSDQPVAEEYDIVRGSRATTVPKSNSIRRMIAVEPTCNMFLQQGVMTLMYQRMKRVGLDVESLPDTHKSLAQEGSITRRLATVDFTSASDCVSTDLLKWLLPPKWFRVFDMIRCTAMKVDGKWIDLNMSSTMGNAVTFPLETLVFWTLGHALLLTAKNETHSLFPEWDDLKSVSVFGDDCIVPDWLYEDFVQVCESVGFMVNKEKSFHGSVPFRESCGGDYLAGRDVRPYTLRSPTSERRSALEPWLYTVANGVIKKYIQYFGTLAYVYDKEFFRALFDLFARHDLLVKVVPNDYPDDSGLKVSEDLARFRQSYPKMRMSTIMRSDQGLYTFRYCSFKYWGVQAQDEEIRYADWLRKPFKQTREPHHFNPIRARGGYVVVRGLSSSMTILDKRPRG